MHIRTLSSDDARAYHTMLLRALRDHPAFFGASYEEEVGRSIEETARQMAAAANYAWHFGAWDGSDLRGIVSLSRFNRKKTRHKAIIGVMYVAPEARQRGIGKALLDHVLGFARALDGLEDLVLAVTVGNRAARKLYIDAGFIPYGIEPRHIQLETGYYDIEWMHMRLH